MLKRTITYEDFDGNQRTEDFYFNMSKAEIAEMEMSKQGGFTAYLKRIIAEEDGPTLVQLFKDLVLQAYGRKSDDGRRFIKSQELRDEFSQTNAYSELFITLATDAEKAAEFVNGIVPSDLDPNKQPKTPQDRKPKGSIPSPKDLAEFEAWKASQLS